MMHWRAEPVPSPTPARSRRPMPSARPQRSEQPVLVRFLTMAVAALLTANGVIIAEQASGRDLITLSRDGVDNAREAVARLLDPNKESTDKVAGQVLEQTTTTTAPGETTTTTGAPAVTPPPGPALRFQRSAGAKPRSHSWTRPRPAMPSRAATVNGWL